MPLTRRQSAGVMLGWSARSSKGRYLAPFTRTFRVGVGGVLVRGVELPAPRHLLRLREGADHVLALVPLAVLHGDVRAERSGDGRPGSSPV